MLGARWISRDYEDLSKSIIFQVNKCLINIY